MSSRLSYYKDDSEDSVVRIRMLPKIFKYVNASVRCQNDEIDLGLNVKEANVRRPISFVCLVDISGSMSSSLSRNDANSAYTRLDMVKYVLNFIITSLTEHDSLGLIAFSENPTIVLDLMNMNEQHKRLARALIKLLQPDAGTYTSPGLRLAYELMKKSPQHNLKSILLLTDGQDSDGDEILRRTFDNIKKSDDIQFNTFGFSNDIYSSTLETLAKLGGGIFGFIPDQSMIGTIFVSFLTNTFRTFIQNLIIEINDDFEFVQDGSNIKKTTLLFGRTRHFLIKKKRPDVNENNLKLRVGFSRDSMFDLLNIKKNKHLHGLKIQKARYKMLELLDDPLLPNIDLEKYEKEIRIPDFLAELKQSNSKDQNREQISLSLKNWDTWGAHYLRSFKFAHLLELNLNFKSPSMKYFSNLKFDEISDKLTEIFITLPKPEAHGYWHEFDEPEFDVISVMNQNTGCILETCQLKLVNGKLKKINELKKDDMLENGSKVVCLIKLKYEGVLVKLNGLYITPYHPVYFQNKWQFPIDIYRKLKYHDILSPFIDLIEDSKPKYVCNLVLDKKHVANVEGIKCITLGHSYKQKVLRHPYYGSSKCIEDFSKLKGWNEGAIEFNKYKIERDENGLVSGLINDDLIK